MNIKPCAKRPVLNPCALKDMNYQIDPYIGCNHYCYYCYALNQAETDWREEVLIHKDITHGLESELEGIPPQTIYMGWETDPYQPCEGEYRQTGRVLELLLKKGFSVSILTKSDLVLRDIDMLKKMNGSMISVSVAFKDNDIRRLFEANTMDTENRINALKKLKIAGIRTAALLCPVIPYITDVMYLVDLLAPHTEKIWIYGLSIVNKSDKNWQNLESILENDFPDSKEQVEAAVFSKNHSYWENLRRDLMELKNSRNLNLDIHL